MEKKYSILLICSPKGKVKHITNNLQREKEKDTKDIVVKLTKEEIKKIVDNFYLMI